MRPPRTGIVDTADVVTLYRAGYHLREIGDVLGCSHEWARQCLIKKGVPLRPRSVHAPEDQPLSPLAEEVFGDLEDHFMDGASIDMLVDWLGETRSAVLLALTELLGRGWALLDQGLYVPSEPEDAPRRSYQYDLQEVERMLCDPTVTQAVIVRQLKLSRGVVAGIANRMRNRRAAA